MRVSREYWKRFLELTVFFPALVAEFYVEKRTHRPLFGWLSFGFVGAAVFLAPETPHSSAIGRVPNNLDDLHFVTFSCYR